MILFEDPPALMETHTARILGNITEITEKKQCIEKAIIIKIIIGIADDNFAGSRFPRIKFYLRLFFRRCFFGSPAGTIMG